MCLVHGFQEKSFQGFQEVTVEGNLHCNTRSTSLRLFGIFKRNYQNIQPQQTGRTSILWERFYSHPCIHHHAVAMPTCYQTAAAAAAMTKMGKASWPLCNNEKSPSGISIPTQITGLARKAITTHRDVKELLCVVQHTDPDGNVSSGGHGRRFVPGVQRADAKGLWGPETLPGSRRHLFWVRLYHGTLHCSLPGLQRSWDNIKSEIQKCVHTLNHLHKETHKCSKNEPSGKKPPLTEHQWCRRWNTMNPPGPRGQGCTALCVTPTE